MSQSAARGAGVTLTSLARGAGCGCKLSAEELRLALGAMSLPVPTRPEVMVGLEWSDDAAVIRIDDHTALVQTLDFFTPIVDDPFTWGQIAATNALSDIYAMGGSPLSALSIVAWPRDQLGWDVLGLVLDGGASVLAAANCALVGGHSIDDAEPKYGLSVTGLIDPNDVMTNAAGRPGDILVLTKPLGTGIATAAIKRSVSDKRLDDAAIAVMLESNDKVSHAAVAVSCRTATDVSGFGLIGHLSELVRASGVAAEIDMAAVPVLDGVRDLVRDGCVPGGTTRNHHDTVHVDWGTTTEVDQIVACDAQTSGGLLLAVAADRIEAFHHAAEKAGAEPVVEIGRLLPDPNDTTGPDEPWPLIRVR